MLIYSFIGGCLLVSRIILYFLVIFFRKLQSLLQLFFVRSRFSKKFYANTDLYLSDLSGPRQVFLGVMDVRFTDHIWGCAKLRLVKMKSIKAVFNNDGVTGTITVQQSSPFSPTDLTLSLGGLQGRADKFHVHHVPFKASQHPGENACRQTLQR